MKLAINYSPQAARLLEQGKISPDLFKCPDWDDVIATAGRHLPVYVHFPLETGVPDAAPTDWARIDGLLAQTGTALVNIHLRLDQACFPAMARHTRAPADRERATERLIAEVRAVTERVGAERVIVENVIYRGYRSTLLRPAAEPSVIREVVDATGCGLLLDLSHARISAYHFSCEDGTTELWGYLEGLPLERLRELHLTGLHFRRESLSDHLEFSDEDWTLLDRVFERIRSGAWHAPDIVAVEYGGIGPIFEWRSDETVIATQLPRLARLVREPDG